MYPQGMSCGSLLKVLTKQADTKSAEIIDKYKSDKWSKKLSTRDQLEIMVGGTSKFSCSSIHKSSLSRVNEGRDYQLFEELFLIPITSFQMKLSSPQESWVIQPWLKSYP